MKKLIALAMILILIVPASALAVDRDPIIGGWYMCYDEKVTPEMASNFSGFDKIFAIYDFTEDGTIMLLEVDLKEGKGTPVYSAAGKWSKENDKYKYSIIGLGQGTAFIKDRELYLALDNVSARQMYLKIRRIEYFDPYSDYVFN